MKCIFVVLLLNCIVSIVNAQNHSLFGGYGTQGINIRYNFAIDDELIKGFKTSFYGEAGLKGKKFSAQNITFRGTNYPSDSRIIFVGFGIEQSYTNKKLSASPYVGIRYVYARVKDKALFEAIGTNNLIRLSGGIQVGPTVENAYGDALTFDAGIRIGFKVNNNITMLVNGGLSPIKFSTTKTLFGKYWGEAPIVNNYYINMPIFKGEVGIKYSF